MISAPFFVPGIASNNSLEPDRPVFRYSAAWQATSATRSVAASLQRERLASSPPGTAASEIHEKKFRYSLAMACALGAATAGVWPEATRATPFAGRFEACFASESQES